MKAKIATKTPSLDGNPEELRHRWMIMPRVNEAKLRCIDVENGAYNHFVQPPKIETLRNRSVLLKMREGFKSLSRNLGELRP